MGLFAFLPGVITTTRTTGGGGGDVTPPGVVSITAIDETTIRFVFNEDTTASLNGYSFTKDGGALSKDALVQINPTTWDFSVGVMSSDNVIRASYDSSTGDTVDGSSNELVSFSNVLVTNSVPAEHPYNLATNNKVVRAGGTPGVDCDYENIDAAETAITTSAIGNEFTLLVKDGVNNLLGDEFTLGSGIFTGLVPKHYLHFYGESQAGTIIKGPVQSTPANEVLSDTFHYPANILVKRCTIKVQNGKYPFHFDTNLFDYNFYGIDLTVEHEGSATQSNFNLGWGMHGGQKFVFRRTTFVNPAGIAGHGNQSATRNPLKHFEIEFIDCTMDLFLMLDYIEYVPNKITFTRCNIGQVILNADSSVYDANPGDPNCNQGFKPYTQIISSGTIVGSVSRNSEAAAMLGSSFSTPADFL